MQRDYDYGGLGFDPGLPPLALVATYVGISKCIGGFYDSHPVTFLH